MQIIFGSKMISNILYFLRISYNPNLPVLIYSGTYL